ncbi:MAG: hypothetical protein M3O70_12135, partial [Actinomycetota bacterium]|nr:hypothetical protein [Actinomycetota bacterium]
VNADVSRVTQSCAAAHRDQFNDIAATSSSPDLAPGAPGPSKAPCAEVHRAQEAAHPVLFAPMAYTAEDYENEQLQRRSGINRMMFEKKIRRHLSPGRHRG